MRRKKNDPLRQHNEKIAQAVVDYKSKVTLEDVLDRLKASGFTLTVEPEVIGITGNQVRACIFDGKVWADHNSCFDKWSRCPYKLPVPKNQRQLEFLMESLKYMGTREAFKLSNEYLMETITEYPMR
jgi:hypothetical protein